MTEHTPHLLAACKRAGVEAYDTGVNGLVAMLHPSPSSRTWLVFWRSDGALNFSPGTPEEVQEAIRAALAQELLQLS